VLIDLEEADVMAAGERSAPRGTLTVTATAFAGETILSPIIDAFLDAYPGVSVRLYLLDRFVNLIDEGIDVALRIAHLSDSSLVATRVGEVRRVVAAAPRYLAQNPRITEPADLAKHQIITFADLGIDSWSFPPVNGSSVPHMVNFTPRLIVNSIRGAIVSAVNGRGVTRVLSYHIPQEVGDGSLEIVLKDHEPPPLPVHLIAPHGRLTVPKVRAFVDMALPRLRSHFAATSRDVV
jgi:DNA-binding transcriptional LysR family regulator